MRKIPTIMNVKNLYRRLLCTTAFCAVLLASGGAQAFQLQDMDGERVNLLDYVGDGSWTLMMFWATDCVACEEQKPALEAFHHLHRGEVAKVVGVVTDGFEKKDEIDKLMALHDPSYPNLVVFTDVFRRQYQELTNKPFRVTPTFLVFGPDGQLRGNLYGYIDFNAISQHVTSQN